MGTLTVHHSKDRREYVVTCGERKEYLHGRMKTSRREGGSCASEEEKHDTELIEGCWEEQIGNAGTSAYMEAAGSGCMIQSSIQPSKCSWSHQVLPPSISTTLSNNLLEFSNSKSQHNSTKPADSSSEKIFKSDFSFLKCNSTATGGALKKARVQGSFTAQSTLKVRKEKLGDRIIALHQIVSPFGKTDTASVLLEAIGYIRFLHSQIEEETLVETIWEASDLQIHERQVLSIVEASAVDVHA
ncbi:hypothetical protein ZIOFF_038447 [Zingiber officinale]|uniref:BHLH domain-containing protein n=1 Tax=Zingiber officinale TaxID=94328 RepID=A0A8J5FZF4_ZINOF|nr:hypothetical protein ZIOFF_038447 [Zingiber officinale]